MTSVLKDMHIDKLDDLVSKYNDTSHNTMKIEPFHVKSSTYIDFNVENNSKDPKFEVGDYVGISKWKIFLQKVTVQIPLKKFL